MTDLEQKLREDICEVARRLYNAGFMAGSDGNLSSILNDHEILITPSRLGKGFLKPSDIAKIDRQGNQLAGDLPVTTEKAVHLAAYEERPDICAVAHCHPPILVAFSVAGLDLPQCILPEIEIMFGGSIPLARYATPGGSALADSIRPFIRERTNHVVLMDHHGLVAVGQDIYQAGIRTEHAEAAAKVIFYARQLGGEKPLSRENVEELHQAHDKVVKLESGVYAGYCHSPEDSIDLENGKLSTSMLEPVNEAELERIVRDAVRQAMQERQD
jgi:L-fuculose-phosphate aldolase